MFLENDLVIKGQLGIDVIPNTTSYEGLFSENGSVKKRTLGTIIGKNIEDYLPYVSNSFPDIFNFNVSSTYLDPTLQVSLKNQVKNTAFLAPLSNNGTPAFRLIQDEDLANTTIFTSIINKANRNGDNLLDIGNWKNVLGINTSYQDLRILSPSDNQFQKLHYGFTSFNNNNVGPWADFIHIGGYGDDSGGMSNVVMISKSGFGLRIYQGYFNSTTPYSEYTDFWGTHNLPSSWVSTWNSQVHYNFNYLETINQHLSIASTPTFNGITVGHTDTYRGFNSTEPYAFFNNGSAQKIYTGGLLVSSAYADNVNIPANGIYSQGTISTASHSNSNAWKDIVLKYLSDPNIASGITIQTFRVENGTNGAYSYSPILHMGGQDTAWQLQANFGTVTGNLQYRSGYQGSYGEWKTVTTNDWVLNYFAQRDGGNLTNIPNWQSVLGINIKVDNMENAVGIGFSNGNYNDAPYFYHTTGGYRFLATQAWVNSLGFVTNPTLNQVVTNGNTHARPLVKGYSGADGISPNIIRSFEGYTGPIARPVFSVLAANEEWGLWAGGNFGDLQSYYFGTADGTNTGIEFGRYGTMTMNHNGNSNPALTIYTNEGGYIRSINNPGGQVNVIASGWEHKWYNEIWRVGNKRGGSSDSMGYVFQFNGSEVVAITPTGRVHTANDASSWEWYHAYTNGILRDSSVGFNNPSGVGSGDGMVNRVWFDYNWAGTGVAGSTISFGGFTGSYQTEIFGQYHDGGKRLGFRTRNNDANSWNLHNWVLHSGNIGPGLIYNGATGVFDVASSNGIFAYSSQGGLYTTNWNSNALAQHSLAIGYSSNAMGAKSSAIGSAVFANGLGTVVLGYSSSSMFSLSASVGVYNYMRATIAGTYGIGLVNNQDGAFVLGRYNAQTTDYDFFNTRPEILPVFILGAGKDENNRRTILQAYQDGRMDYINPNPDTWTNNTLITKKWAEDNLSGGGGGSNFRLGINQHPLLSGDVTLFANGGITLTQTGQGIWITGSGGGGGGGNNTDQFIDIDYSNVYDDGSSPSPYDYPYNGIITKINVFSVGGHIAEEDGTPLKAVVLEPDPGYFNHPNENNFYSTWGIYLEMYGVVVHKGTIKIPYMDNLEKPYSEGRMHLVCILESGTSKLHFIDSSTLRSYKYHTQTQDTYFDLVLLGTLIKHRDTDPDFIFSVNIQFF